MSKTKLQGKNLRSHTTLSAKGQVVIPQPIRKTLGLKPGDRLDVESIEGSIVLRPRRNLLELAGAFAGADSLADFIVEEHRREREEEDAGWEPEDAR